MFPQPTSFVHLFEVFLCISVNFVEIGLGFWGLRRSSGLKYLRNLMHVRGLWKTEDLSPQIARVLVKGLCSVKFHWKPSRRERGDGAQLFSHLSRNGSSLWCPGSSQVSTNALRGFSLNEALGSPRWWKWSRVGLFTGPSKSFTHQKGH